MERYDDGYGGDAYEGGPFEGTSDDDIFVEPPADDDAIEHLWNAAHELLRAVRTIVDAADEFVASQRRATSRRAPREHAPQPEPEPRVRRIDIDESRGADDPGDRSSGPPGAP